AQVPLAGLLELAQDLGALRIPLRSGLLRGGGFLLGRLVEHDLLAHEHIDRLAVLATAHGELLLAVAAERDLPRRCGASAGTGALAVGAAQEAQQFHLLGAGHDLVGIAELHAGLGQLFKQFLNRCVHQGGQLADGGLLRHSDSVSLATASAAADETILTGAGGMFRARAPAQARPGPRGAGPAGQPSASSRAISPARAARISAAARSSSMPSMLNSSSSSVPSSDRSSAVRIPCAASE